MLLYVVFLDGAIVSQAIERLQGYHEYGNLCSKLLQSVDARVKTVGKSKGADGLSDGPYR